MTTPTDTAVSKMQDFLDTCTSEQISELMQVLEATQEKYVTRGSPDAASTMTAKAGVSAKRTGKKQRKKKEKPEGATGGPKRPLNSWMAFRKYYNGSLAPSTQKAISKVLTIMWRADPFEAKWAMLAKAYSVVRGGREKEDAPLDEFLALCGPLIGVIHPDEYRQVMGWQLNPADADDKEKIPQLVRLYVPNFPAEHLTTTLSVDDLVKRCHAAGYIKDGGDETVTHSASGSLTMAVQPTINTINEATSITEAGSGTNAVTSASSAMMQSLSPTDVEFEAALRAALEEAPTVATSLADASAALYGLGTQWPHNNNFDPAANFDISFDPTIGDAWHAQNLMTTSNGDIDWDGFLNFGPN